MTTRSSPIRRPASPLHLAAIGAVIAALGAGHAAAQPPTEPAVTAAIADLGALGAEVRSTAVERLVDAGPAAIDAIGALLADASASSTQRYGAWRALQRLAPHAAPLRAMLLDIVDRDALGDGARAAEVVAAIDLAGAEAIAARARAAVGSHTPWPQALRAAAARGAEPAIEALVPLTLAEQRRYGGGVDGWLGALGSTACSDAAGRALGRLVASGDAEDRRDALAALARIGVHAAPAAPAVLALLRDGATATAGDDTAAAIVAALAAAGPRATDTIAGVAADGAPFARAIALRSLAHHVAAPRPTGEGPALTAILGALDDADAGARFAAIHAASAHGAAAVPGLIAALADPGRRRAAIAALARLGPLAAAARDALRAIADDSLAVDRDRATAALEAIDA